MGHLLQDCGIDFERVRKYERGPCLHCFRHTFVAKAFDQLLQTPLDFADAVPFISTYLGHCDLRETDKYLQANYDFFQRDHTLITDYTRYHRVFLLISGFLLDEMYSVIFEIQTPPSDFVHPYQNLRIYDLHPVVAFQLYRELKYLADYSRRFYRSP